MKTLFQSRPGAVIKLDDPAIQCETQLLGLKPDITYEVERSIVTRVSVCQRTNVQFLHTLGGLIYIYVFGDRIGTIGLSGLSFACPCPDSGEVGAEKMLMWYNKNRASKRKEPIEVTIGRMVIRGFVLDVQQDVVDPALNLVQWNVTVNALPEEDS